MQSAKLAAAGEMPHLVLVAEQDVDRAASIMPSTPSRRPPMHRLSDRVKATVRPAEWAISRRLEHCRARPLGPPQIAFEEGHARRANQPRSSASGVSSWLAPGQVFIVRWASGVTRIRQRPVGGGAASGGVSNANAERAHVVRENVAELVVRDLADEGDVEAQRGRARHAVRRRPAADLARRSHRRVELVGLHRSSAAASPPFGRPRSSTNASSVGRDDVDDRIADRHDVEAGGSHGRAR